MKKHAIVFHSILFPEGLEWVPVDEFICTMNQKSMNKTTILALSLGLIAWGGVFSIHSQAGDYSVLATAWTIRFGGSSAEKPLEAEALPEQTWTPLFAGIDFRKAEESDPLQKVCVMRIDTRQEGLLFYTNGRYKDFKEGERETERTTTADFLTENDLNVAVNANFYSPFNAETRTTRGPSNVIGLAVSEGVLVSPSEASYPAFTVSSNGVASIGVIRPDEPLEGVRTAVAGNMIVLKEGKVVEQGDKSVHPRTAVGISQDGRYVYIMTIDGRQPTYSIGATYEEIGRWMLEFGAWEALNLDGGGSTTMVTRDDQGKAKVLNSPVGNANLPGYLRHNANYLGVVLRKAE